jgi:hypothetical protein
LGGREISSEWQAWSKNENRGGHTFLFCTVSSSSWGRKPPANQTILPSLGLKLGQQAPAFALTDQFGHEPSNEKLKGTVLLFFRSADW